MVSKILRGHVVSKSVKKVFSVYGLNKTETGRSETLMCLGVRLVTFSGHLRGKTKEHILLISPGVTRYPVPVKQNRSVDDRTDKGVRTESNPAAD